MFCSLFLLLHCFVAPHILACLHTFVFRQSCGILINLLSFYSTKVYCIDKCKNVTRRKQVCLFLLEYSIGLISKGRGGEEGEGEEKRGCGVSCIPIMRWWSAGE